MARPRPSARGIGIAVLVAARIVYAYNWYNVGAVLPLIGASLHASTADLGIVLGAFLIGVAIFQIPAGLASVRFGARRVSLAGLALFGAAGVASAFAPSWPTLASLRLLAGVGAAFFFSPALSLVAASYPSAEKGPLIGLFNGGFSIGGGLGLLLGASLGLAEGWPAALGFGGLALLASTLIALVTVIDPAPPAPTGAPPNSLRRTSRAVLGSRGIWGLSLGITGFWAAVYIVAQYFVDFAHLVHPDWGLRVAAVLAAVVVLVAFPAGPIGGWLAERGGDRRVLLVWSCLGASLLVFLVPYAPLLLLAPILVVFGFLDGLAFAVLYLIPAYLPETQGEGLALGLAVVNSVQVLLGSAIAIAFGLLAEADGYPVAWIFAGLVSLALLGFVAAVPSNRAGRPITPSEAPVAPG